jgi:hypothetical protein
MSQRLTGESAPWFIVHATTGALLCHPGRGFSYLWGRDLVSALRFFNRQTAMSRVWSARKVMPAFEYKLMAHGEVMRLWGQEPELLTLAPAPALVVAPQVPQVPQAPQAVAVVEPEVQQPNELVMAAFAQVVDIQSEEQAAYQLWREQRTRLRNAKQRLRFLEQSCACKVIK